MTAKHLSMPSGTVRDPICVPETVWESVGEKCFMCGGCCYICPTCTCFQVIDHSEKDKFNRIRLWDSCRFAGFSRLGAGFNPREHIRERIKRRFYCKFVYSAKNHGMVSCVGCGRCNKVCYTDIEMQSTIKETSKWN